MKKWRITYADNTHEDITGSALIVLDGVLTIELHMPGSWARRSRSWPLTSIRSWEML